MNAFRFLILGSLLIFLFLPLTQAKSSPEFIEYLSSMVYEDCEGVFFKGEPITRELVKEEIVKIDDQLPTGLSVGPVETFPKVMSCTKNGEEYSLRVNFDEYYWRDRKVGNSATYNFINQVVENVVAERISQVAVQGSENTINTGQMNYIEIGVISAGISFTFSLALYFIVRNRLGKKK